MGVPIVDPRLAAAGYSEDPIQKKLQIDELKKHLEGGQNKDKELRGACQDFEAVFIQKIWEQMRQSVPKGGYLHSRDEEMYQSLFDVEFSKKMASAGGIGLADMLYEQLNVKLGKASRATTPSMLRNSQEMKELDEGQGMNFEPRYGSLRRDPQTEMALLDAEGGGDGIYDELREESLEYVNPYSQAGVSGPVQEVPDSATQADQPDAGLAEAARPEDLQQSVHGLNAYLGSLQRDFSAVGSVGAAKAGFEEASGAPRGIGAADSRPQAENQGVKFLDPTTPGGLGEAAFNPANLNSPGEPQQPAAIPDIPGFAGMKPPFTGLQPAGEREFPLSYGFAGAQENLMPQSIARPGELDSQTADGSDAAVMPEEVVAPPAGMKLTDEPAAPSGAATPAADSAGVTGPVRKGETTENNIPQGMFLQFDSVPEI